MTTLIAPLVTEKTANMSAKDVYAFRVHDSATRIAVAQDFKKQFKVTALAVNIVRTHGKPRRFGRKAFHRADWKKAYVTVPKGTKIDLTTPVKAETPTT